MQSLKIKTTLRILTTAFAVIPMLIVGIVGYFSMTGFAANSVSQFARAAGAAQQEIINQYSKNPEYVNAFYTKQEAVDALNRHYKNRYIKINLD